MSLGPLDDRHVGLAAAFAHGDQAVAAAGPLQGVYQRGQQAAPVAPRSAGCTAASPPPPRPTGVRAASTMNASGIRASPLQTSVVLTAALAEEDGDDPRIPSASATRRNGRWVLSGVKTAVPAAPRADLFLVPATISDGVLVFLVGPSDAGVTVEPQRLTDFAEAGRVVLDGVTLDDDRVLGPGAQVADWLVARGTVGLCAAQAGVIERALELTAEYARNRVQFGRPIGSFQAVTQRLADAYVDTEAVRLTMWQAAWLLATCSAAAPAPAEVTAVATAKFWAAEAGHRVAHTAVHVHGGLGIDTSYPVHRYFVAAKHHEFALGGATAQLRRIGAILAGPEPPLP